MNPIEQIVVAVNELLGPVLHLMSSGSSELALGLGLF